jgi:hypothetical protein
VPPSDLAATRERADSLERERDELLRQIEAQRHRNTGLEATVADAERGVLPRGSGRRVLLVLVALLALGAGVYLYHRRTAGIADHRQVAEARRLLRSIATPHLLVTSNVDKATVRVDGRLVGVTPAVLALPPGHQTYDLLVEAPGHTPIRRQVDGARDGGRQLHARLDRAAPVR